MMTDNDIIKDDALTEYFYPHKVMPFYKRKVDFIVDNVKSIRVLDAGVGSGYISTVLKENNFNVFALDAELSAVQECKLITQIRGINFPLVLALLPHTPFQDKEFDSVVCTDVIEHILDLYAAFIEFRRILKDDGKLVIALPNGYGYDTFANIYSKRNNAVNKKIQGIGIDIAKKYKKYTFRHIHKFTPTLIKKYLQEAGFKIVKFENTAFLPQYISGFFSGILGCKRTFSAGIERFDVKVAKFLPLFLGSHWLLACEKA